MKLFAGYVEISLPWTPRPTRVTFCKAADDPMTVLEGIYASVLAAFPLASWNDSDPDIWEVQEAEILKAGYVKAGPPIPQVAAMVTTDPELQRAAEVAISDFINR